MKKYILIFAGAFIFTFTAQWQLWQNVGMNLTDAVPWQGRIQNFMHDIKRRPLRFPLREGGEFRYGVQPGMTTVLAAASLSLSGADERTSLHVGVALLNALIVGGIAVISAMLRPSYAWWLITIPIIGVHYLSFLNTPPSLVAAALLTLTMLISLLIYERVAVSPTIIILYGITIGAGLATHIPITLLVAAPMLVWLWRQLRRHWVKLISVIGLTFFVLNPLLWVAPMDFVRLFTQRAGLHLVNYYEVPLTPIVVLLMIPLPLISIVIALVIIFMKRLSSPIPKPFLGFLIVLTGAVAVMVTASKGQSLRYLMPYIYLWDILLPLWLLHFSKQLPGRGSAYRLTVLIIIFSISSYFYLLAHHWQEISSDFLILGYTIL